MLAGPLEQVKPICSMIIIINLLFSVGIKLCLEVWSCLRGTSFGVDISVSRIGIISDGYSLVVRLGALCGSVPCSKL